MTDTDRTETPPFRTGLDVLLEEQRALLTGRRVGLLTHAAALTVDGQWSAERLWRDADVCLIALLGPEHGVFGQAGAGVRVGADRHPVWDIPVHSLYGACRAPTPEMLAGLDVLLIDLQDLAVRCYTFVSTLRLALEAAARAGLTTVVTDRPTPFPSVCDGPVLDPAFRSFVADIEAPLVYGMTQGETARYLHAQAGWDLDLHVVPMQGYDRDPHPQPGWPPWVPPSTGIRAWESAWCYPVTVFTEALPSLDCGRGGPLPFQVLSAEWLRGRQLIEHLPAAALPGLRVEPHPTYLDLALVEGIRFVVTDPDRLRPVTTGVAILHALQSLYGPDVLWNHPDARADFFDQLCGTDRVRRGLQDGESWDAIVDPWPADREVFAAARREALLYP